MWLRAALNAWPLPDLGGEIWHTDPKEAHRVQAAAVEAEQSPEWRAMVCGYLLVTRQMMQRKIVIPTRGMPMVDELPIYDLGLAGNATALCDHLACIPGQNVLDGLALLTCVVEAIPRPVTERRLLTVTDRAEKITLVRQPAVVAVAILSELEAVAVDGEPFVTAGPEAGLLAHYRARPRAAQRELPFAGPRRINGHLIGSPVVRALQAFPLTGDERSPIRGDTLRLAVIGYALTGPMLIDEQTGALLFGANTEANRKRFWEASRVFHHLELTDPKTGRYVTMGHAPANGRVVSLGAPFWWRGKGEGQQWSLTGRLFGPRFDSRRGSGGAAGFQSGLNRTLAGLESALAYSSPSGKGSTAGYLTCCDQCVRAGRGRKPSFRGACCCRWPASRYRPMLLRNPYGDGAIGDGWTR